MLSAAVLLLVCGAAVVLLLVPVMVCSAIAAGLLRVCCSRGAGALCYVHLYLKHQRLRLQWREMQTAGGSEMFKGVGEQGWRVHTASHEVMCGNQLERGDACSLQLSSTRRGALFRKCSLVAGPD